MSRVPRIGSLHTFRAVSWDRFAPHSGTPDNGETVRVIQPYGCPKNGTMGHCYVEVPDDEFPFPRLVLLASLTKLDKAGQTAQGRD